MAMLRGSYRYQVLKFESEQRRRQNEEMDESSEADILQSTQHLSMSEQTLGLDTDSHKVRAASLKRDWKVLMEYSNFIENFQTQNSPTSRFFQLQVNQIPS